MGHPGPQMTQITQIDRSALVSAILSFLQNQDLLALDDIRRWLEDEIDAAGPDALAALRSRLTTDLGWDYYERDPLAQRIHRLLADRFLAPGSELRNAHHLAAIAGAPVVLVANHLSYADANAIEVLLHSGGGAELADRLTAGAGPKVYSDRQRRFSSLCFGTIKVPQSAEVSSEEAVMSPRDVARAARRAIEVANARLDAGDGLLIFGEGTRSRTGALQPMLAGVARYLERPDTWVLPVSLTGTEALFPVEGATICPARVTLTLGTPMQAEALLVESRGDRRLAMDAVGLAIAGLLPDSYRGMYQPPAHTAAAAVLDRLKSA
jgi:1-acyl-sn-glycerol-3-phosphate acyltransferase